jgi:uncharacterized protein YndB with AHSA1/START domain/DNA-binding transcriptional ArsR family regulator
MVKYQASAMDRTFSALADPTRRHVLLRLKDEPGLSVSELARPLSLKLPGMMKHLDVLSDAGLITRTKTGRTVSVHLSAEPMREAMAWLNRYERFWTVSLDRLIAFVEEDERAMTDSLPSVTLVRRIKASPAKVWAAITQPDQMMQWWGPDAGPTLSVRPTFAPAVGSASCSGCSTATSTIRPGSIGKWFPSKKLVFTWEWPGAPEPESLVTFLLEPFDGGTELTLTHEHLPDEAARDQSRARLERPARQAARFPWRCRMSDLILTTYDWVPEPPRGFVRDLRVRWALEEAGLPYRVESTPFEGRKPEHFAHQPFGQVPWLTDGDLSIFESGAILLHLGELSDTLMPTDRRGRSDTKEWLFAALAPSRPRASPGPSSCSRATPTKRRCGSSSTTSSLSTGSSTWRRSWRDANGWPGASRSPTS